MSDSEEEQEITGKKRKLNKEMHTKEIEKLARQRGEEFVTHTGKLVEAKVTGPDCTCRKKCMENFSSDEKRSIIEIIYNGRPKMKKILILLG